MQRRCEELGFHTLRVRGKAANQNPKGPSHARMGYICDPLATHGHTTVARMTHERASAGILVHVGMHACNAGFMGSFI